MFTAYKPELGLKVIETLLLDHIVKNNNLFDMILPRNVEMVKTFVNRSFSFFVPLYCSWVVKSWRIYSSPAPRRCITDFVLNYPNTVFHYRNVSVFSNVDSKS